SASGDTSRRASGPITEVVTVPVPELTVDLDFLEARTKSGVLLPVDGISVPMTESAEIRVKASVSGRAQAGGHIAPVVESGRGKAFFSPSSQSFSDSNGVARFFVSGQDRPGDSTVRVTAEYAKTGRTVLIPFHSLPIGAHLSLEKKAAQTSMSVL